MRNQRLLILRASTIALLKHVRGPGTEVRCERCFQPLEPGELVLRKFTYGKAKYYHQACWESMFIEA
jgi:hypothetical protein